MKLEKVFYWSSRAVLLMVLSITIFLSGVTMAIVFLRIMPLVSPFLSANINQISGSRGAQFISAAFPVREVNQNFMQRMRIDPLIPFFVSVAILRKIKPVDNLLKRFWPGVNGQPASSQVPQAGQVNLPSFDMEVPDISQVLEADGSLPGIVPGDTLNSVRGRYLNFGLSLLFLLLALCFMLLTSWFMKVLVSSFNSQSKNFVSSAAEFSGEIKSLPAVIDELTTDSSPAPVKKKTTAKSKK